MSGARNLAPVFVPEKNTSPRMETRSSQIPFHLNSHLENILPIGFSHEVKQLEASSLSHFRSSSMQTTSFTELHVTNLDQSIGAKDLKTILTSVFSQHVTVKSFTLPCH